MSFTDNYLKLRKKKEEEEDIAPVKGKSSYTKEEADSIIKQISKQNIKASTPLTSVIPKKYLDDTREAYAEHSGADMSRWFDAGAFKDGWDFGDSIKTIIGSATDFTKHGVAGVINMGELAIDTALTLAPYAAQAQYYANGGGFNPELDAIVNQAFDDAKKGNAEIVKKDLIKEDEIARVIISEPIKFVTGVDSETDSVLGKKADALAKSAGQLAGTVALQSVGVPWWLTTGVTTFGSEAENALNSGATMDEAVLSGAVSAGAEILTEKLSGGISFGGKTLDDGLTALLASNISKKTTRTLIKLGVDATGEGFEEVLSGALSAVGQKLTYDKDKDMSFNELFLSEEAFDSFIGGFVLGGGSSTISVVKSSAKGVDSVTELTDNEQKVVDRVYAESLAEAEKGKGKKLNPFEKSKLYDSVIENLEKGGISIDTIEEVLGGDTYKSYKDILDNEDSLARAEKSLSDEFTELNKMKNGEMTGEQTDRREDLRNQLKVIRAQIEASKNNTEKSELKAKLSNDVFGLAKDSKLVNSYIEYDNRGKAFEADVSKYDAKYQAIVQKAIDSGILNNTRRTHEFVDFIAKLAADKGVSFDFLNNEKLKNSRFARDNAFVNGYYDKASNTIGVNIDSPKAWQTTVGHEITHVLEGTELYTELQNALFEYSKSKGDFDSKREALANLYDEADIDSELTSDLVGEYLFTDEDFIFNLSTKNRNVFQKIYDEIKYLLKIATAGSKEARQLEKVKKAFEKAYRESGNTSGDGDTKFSVSDKKTLDKNSQMRYNTTGWASDNNILTAGQIDNFYSRFSAITANLESAKDITTKSGEYMIPVSDIYDNSKQGIQNVIVYAKGTLDNPVITAVLEIDAYNETELSDLRSIVYEAERRGIPQKTEGVFRRYDSFDYENTRAGQSVPHEIEGYNNQFGAVRGTSGRKASRAVSYRTNEKGHRVYYSENDIAPTKVSSKDDAFFDGKKTKFSLSDNNIKDVSTGYAYGESYYTMSYTQDGKVVATLNYGEYDGKPNIKMIEVEPEYRRKGIATKLLQELQKKYSGEEIDFGMSTPDGTKLLDSITYDVTDEAVAADIQKYKDLQTELNELQKKLDILYDTENLTDAQDKELHTLGDRWQEVYETIHDLEQSLRGKKATKTFVKTDTKYSLSDSDGKKLTNEQSEFFKDSKMRDDNGNLKVMYHGSQDAGFHIFDSSMSDDDTSFFFVDRNDVAASYSGTSETYEAQTIRTAEDMNNFLAKIGYDNYEAVERDGKYELLENNEHVAYSDTAQGLYEEFCWYEGVGEGDANYKVYLNLKNPLVIDAKGRPWNKIDAEFSQEVYDRYQSLTDEEKAALTDLAEWEDFSLFNSEIQEAKDNELASAYAKMGEDCNIYDLFSVAADSFSDDSMRENSRRYLKTRDFAQRAKEGGYDGVIFKDIVDNGGYSNGDEGASTVAIAFESEQIKSVANKKPTSDPDIRFSLSESVEETKDLVAMHNVRADKLMAAFRLGGLPSPSVAITKSDILHDNYGDITLLMRKDAIDPQADSRNKVYGSDAWTPTISNARTEYEVDTKKVRAFEERLAELSRRVAGGAFVRDSVVRGMGIDDFSDQDAKRLSERLANYDEVRAAYLADNGKTVEPEYKTKEYSKFGNAALQKYIDRIGVQRLASIVADSYTGDTASIQAEEEAVKQIIRDAYIEKHAYALNKRPDLKDIRVNLYMDKNVNAFTVEDFINDAWEFYQDGGAVTEEIDRLATSDKLRSAVNDADVRAWLEPQIAAFLGEPGIYNGKDLFTADGRRRSFAETHYTYTAENIVKAMQNANARGEGTFGAHANSLIATATPSYQSIAEMHADKGRLKLEDAATYEKILSDLDSTLESVEHDIMRTTKHHADNTFEEEQIIGSIITEAATGTRTVAAVQRAFAKEGYKISTEQAKQILSLYDKAANVPTGYFEAKPERVVGFDEVGVFVIPRNADVKLKQELLNRGYAIAEYDPDVEGDRQKVVNSFEKYKFSLSDVDVREETPKQYGRWNVSARDLRVIGAPVREDLTGATEKVSVGENTAPIQNAVQGEFEGVAEDSLEALKAEYEALANQVGELHKAGDREKARRLALQLNELAKRIDAERKNAKADNVTPDGFAPMTESEADVLRSESFSSLDDADVPPEIEATYYGEGERTAITLDRVTARGITSEVNAALGLDAEDSAKMTEVIENYARDKNLTESDLFDEIQREFQYSEEVANSDDTLKAAQNHMKRTKIYVPKEIKADFNGRRKDGFGAFKNEHFGHFYLTTNENVSALKIDQLYQELNGLYPGLFPDNIWNTAEQLMRMGEVADTRLEAEIRSMPYDDDTVNEVVRIISEGINRYSEGETLRLVNEGASDYLDSVGATDDIGPTPESVPRIEKEAATSYETAKKGEVNGQQTMFREPEIKAEEPIKTVKDRLQHKLNSAYGELSHNKRLRRESIESFNAKIAELQLEYDNKKNKDTKVANDILRRIERLTRMRDEVDADYTKRMNDNRARVDKYKELVEEGYSDEEGRMMRTELHAQKVDEIRNAFSENGLDFDETLKNAKDLSTFRTVDNTPQRVMEKSLGYKGGQVLADATVNKVAQNESEGIKWLNSITSRSGEGGLLKQLSKKYHIKPGTKESAAAQMYAEGFYVDENNKTIKYGDAELAKDFPNAETQKNIKGLANDPRIRQFYDDTLAMINESRTRNAYPEIKPLDNYFLHFRAMDDTFSRMGIPFNPNDIKAKDLPTDLNGVTADLKPGQPYFSSAMHRRGKKTSYDLLGGMERYATGAKNQIYHIDDIQTLRALRNYIADTYGQANGLDNLDNLSEEEVQDRIKQVYNSHLSTFAKFLNEEANVIAGKTALIDRGLEGIIGRRGIQFLSTINQQVGSNMVGGNVSSAGTNFLPVVQAFAKTNKSAFVKGFAQTVANKVGHVFGKADSFADNPTAIRRKGADRFYRTPWQKTADAGYALMSAVDNISTEVIVRAKYNEFIKKGMSEQQAILEADKWASRLMGDRSLGQMPQLYNSKMLGLITKFQLEVRNQLDSQFYDTVQETKASNEDIDNALKRNAKTAAKVAVTFAELAVAQHIFGAVFESIAGYNPAFDIIDVIIKACGFDDDEESEDTALDNLEQGFLALLEDLPYTSTFTGGRIPISSALPIKELVTGEDEYGNEVSRLKTLGEVAPYYLLPTGYGQAKKTAQGLSMFSDEHPVAGSYTESGNLRFPVEDTLGNRIQAGLFGQWASENAGYYFDNDIAPLKEKQIEEYIDSEMTIKEYWKYRKELSKYDSLAEKADYINSLDLTDEQKNLLINNIADRKEPIDMSNYDDFDSFEEFDFATKNPEKYSFFKENGISFEDYKNADEDGKRAYTWACENPEGYKVAKAISDDFLTYYKYKSDLYDIRADKDENGDTIVGSAKDKKAEYINGLDLDYGQKIILFKSLYNADDTYNYDIIEYLNEREDISYEEMETILKELGFDVDSEGNISWD